MDKIDKFSIISDLKALGIKKGDVLFVTADLQKVGYLNKNKSQTLNDWITIFMEVLGEEGTLIVAAYTDTFLRIRKNKNCVFERDTRSTAGAFSNALVSLPNAIRSTHPTHSCIGLGFYAKEILSEHTEKSLSYSVLGSIIEKEGKFLLLGTIDNNNAPQALHYVQEKLGLTKYTPYKYLFQTFYKNDKNEIKLYTKKDFGGCSRGGKNLIGDLLVNNAIIIRKVGNADTGIMDGKKSYEVIMKLMMNNRRIIQCNDKNCIDCYGNFIYNGVFVIPFFIRFALRKFFN